MYFAFRIDVWDDDGNSVVEQLAGLDDHGMAVAAYEVAVALSERDFVRWPRARGAQKLAGVTVGLMPQFEFSGGRLRSSVAPVAR